jgi:hypothetical protein
MANTINHLIWLGAGTATQPAGLLQQAMKATLIEARADACAELKKQRPSAKISVLQSMISAKGGDVKFNEYNLAEFSALHKATGLLELFPGLKRTHEQSHSSAIVTELLQQADLGGDNNALVLDIADLNLTMLQQLQHAGLMQHFSQLWLQGSNVPLYQGAVTRAELTAFLQQHGYTLSSEDATDPDLPWLHFSLNPLWQRLHQAEKATEELSKQLEAAKQQAAASKQQAEQANAELSKQLEAAKQQAGASKQQAEQANAELSKQLEAAKQQAGASKQQAEQANAELSKQLDAAKQQAAASKQQAEQANAELSKQLEAAKQQAVASKQQAEQANAELSKQLAAAKQQAAASKQQAEQANAELSKQLEAAKQQAAASNQQAEQLTQQCKLAVSGNETLQQQLSTVKLGAEKIQAELNGRIASLDAERKTLTEQQDKLRLQLNSLTEQNKQVKTEAEQLRVELIHNAEQFKLSEQQQTKLQATIQADLQQVTKQATARLEKVTQLEKVNRQLTETNDQLTKRQYAMQQEMLKAQAQIEIIKDLLLKQ